MRTIFPAVMTFVFWLLLSGHTAPLLISLGVASSAVVIYLSHKMNIIDNESHPFHLSFRLAKYYIYLGKEIILSNIYVIKCILSPGKTISPCIITLPAEQKSDLGKVIYANSITLTPGTVTLELSNDKIKVHALSKQTAADLQTGEMSKAIPDDVENT